MGGGAMGKQFTLEYWITENWYVGKLKEVPGVFSQGKTLDELEENVRDAYAMMLDEDTAPPHVGVHTKALEVAV
jgi:predicted RNase H-like HicB family nuclease